MPTAVDHGHASQRSFSKQSEQLHRRLSKVEEKHGTFSRSLTPLFMGISAAKVDGKAVIALAAHDQTYLVDFTVQHIPLDADNSHKSASNNNNIDTKENSNGETKNLLEDGTQDVIADWIVTNVQTYERSHHVKFVGAGVPDKVADQLSPTLCSRLWLETDIVPLVLKIDGDVPGDFWDAKHLDEQADSMARKCVMNFGPSLTPLLQVGFRGLVMTDAGFKARMNRLLDHQGTNGETTWRAVNVLADRLKERGTKIAFFSATPQGGGVALMRHALVRFSKLMGVDLRWYVPKPRPGVFRNTKNMHNILQGVADKDDRLSEEQRGVIHDWITDNAERYWLAKDGPLRKPEEGGADIIVIDDPQMPGLIPLIKKTTPDRPVLYRSHIQVRSDLVAQKGSPQSEVWDYLWHDIQHADAFISHPIPEFVPHNVPRDKVMFMPATTDWCVLDGLNKPMNDWDRGYYASNYNLQCHVQDMTPLRFKESKYIVQVARFDPAKGIDTVIDAYAEFCRLAKEKDIKDIPQLVVTGNSSVDDPDGTRVYDAALTQIETHFPHLATSISVMRLDANDQLLNTLIAGAHVVLQLSTREGFEVKVSEALHAGRPVIATRAGGIPVQVQHEKNGFLVEPGDYKEVARRLVQLFEGGDGGELWREMSKEARTGVSDEVSTVGNALCWYYLADLFVHRGGLANDAGGVNGEAKSRKTVFRERWVNDLAREEAGVPYEKGENRLPRHFTERK
ncbi:family 4 glycosyltransferase [Microdochium trichocladiopsis]|uniref:Family 4 glycosyltransferase n=1 Tax=Microdochium trichocladiopsis TaxID=1682393 RepID=A0A9P8XXB3_9PEZI|nr:family 4 glycosyltransferase [Microdochium trichocladiopsis]KAH7021092.1 family 4 glycosyltransferase [Microdochium trichocladiopsis]